MTSHDQTLATVAAASKLLHGAVCALRARISAEITATAAEVGHGFMQSVIDQPDSLSEIGLQRSLAISRTAQAKVLRCAVVARISAEAEGLAALLEPLMQVEHVAYGASGTVVSEWLAQQQPVDVVVFAADMRGVDKELNNELLQASGAARVLAMGEAGLAMFEPKHLLIAQAAHGSCQQVILQPSPDRCSHVARISICIHSHFCRLDAVPFLVGQSNQPNDGECAIELTHTKVPIIEHDPSVTD